LLLGLTLNLDQFEHGILFKVPWRILFRPFGIFAPCRPENSRQEKNLRAKSWREEHISGDCNRLMGGLETMLPFSQNQAGNKADEVSIVGMQICKPLQVAIEPSIRVLSSIGILLKLHLNTDIGIRIHDTLGPCSHACSATEAPEATLVGKDKSQLQLVVIV
jgi:hypothetical protein